MCGIAGAFFVRDRELTDRFAATASASLAHRGPDDADQLVLPEGIFVHRRLSILDPSPAGRQPFTSRDGLLHVIHNGEIYNYLELREELRAMGHEFRTDTDTEVILAAYRAWGEAAVEHFNGIWAFALWDAHERTLLLSRDRLGVKPLYLLEADGGLLFASEIKALLTVSASAEPNLGAVRDYLWHGLVDHADQTFYTAIQPLPPATNLTIGPSSRRTRRYWTLSELSSDADPRPAPADATSLGDFDVLLHDAIALQLRSDVALGTCLSGGLDSVSLVGITAQLVNQRIGAHQAAPRIAITAGFPGTGDDETERAASAASAIGIQHLVVRPAPDGLLDTLQALLAEQDEPFISSSILAQRSVMEGARDAGVKVMLDGQGADETLAGYPHYRYPWLLGLAGARPSAVPHALRALRRLGIRPSVALRQAALSAFQLGAGSAAPIGRNARPPRWVGSVLRRAAPLPLRDGSDSPRPGTPLARHLRRAILSTSLPALLRYEDRNSMRFGIEARVPYLDHRLVEAAMRLPDRLKIADGITKVALRRIGAGRVPEAIRTDQRKIGFSTPQDTWLADARASIATYFQRSMAVNAGLINPDGLGALVAGPISGSNSDGLWRCLSIEAWLRR